jgi:hypothetical protein
MSEDNVVLSFSREVLILKGPVPTGLEERLEGRGVERQGVFSVRPNFMIDPDTIIFSGANNYSIPEFLELVQPAVHSEEFRHRIYSRGCEYVAYAGPPNRSVLDSHSVG